MIPIVVFNPQGFNKKGIVKPEKMIFKVLFQIKNQYKALQEQIQSLKNIRLETKVNMKTLMILSYPNLITSLFSIIQH